MHKRYHEIQPKSSRTQLTRSLVRSDLDLLVRGIPRIVSFQEILFDRMFLYPWCMMLSRDRRDSAKVSDTGFQLIIFRSTRDGYGEYHSPFPIVCEKRYGALLLEGLVQAVGWSFKWLGGSWRRGWLILDHMMTYSDSIDSIDMDRNNNT